MKKAMIVVLALMLLVGSGCTKTDPKQSVYEQAEACLREGKFSEARELFASVADYGDSAERLQKFVYLPIEVRTDDYGFGEAPILCTETFTYDAAGHCTEAKGVYENNAGPEYRETNEYTDGLLTRTFAVGEAGDSTITYEYNDARLPIRRVGVTEGANVGGITEFSYDAAGKCTRMLSKSYIGTDAGAYAAATPYSVDDIEFTYDAQGRCTEVICRYSENSLTYSVGYDEGRISGISCEDGESMCDNTTFGYDDAGRCVKVVTSYNTAEFTFDENGRLQSSKEWDTAGQLMRSSQYTLQLFYLEDGAPAHPFWLETYVSALDPMQH